MGLCISKPRVMYAVVLDQNDDIRGLRIEDPTNAQRADLKQMHVALKIAIGKRRFNEIDRAFKEQFHRAGR